MTQFISKEKEEAVYSVRIVCGLLFVLFSVSYLCMQTPLLEALQHMLSEGKTSYAMWWGAIIITLVLVILQMLVSFLSRWVSYLHALSYIPSFLCLVLLTNHHRELYQLQMPEKWNSLILIVLGAYLLAVLINRFGRSAWNSFYVFSGEVIRYASNIFLMVLLAFSTLALSELDESFHCELQFESLARSGRPDQALQVGRRRNINSRLLTALRAYQLSRIDQLGDLLFRYPQPYGSEALLLGPTVRQTYLTVEEQYAYLGDVRMPREGVRAYLERLCHTEKGSHASLDYYLCALLLDRDLDTFVRELDDYYDLDEELSMHYQEALVTYAEEHPDYHLPFSADALFAAYEEDASSETPDPQRYWTYYHQ
jgi:hypothetical protein